MSTACRSGPRLRPQGHEATPRRRLRAVVAAASMTLAVAAQAASVIDAPNDFLPTFAGTASPDLDVLSLSVTFDGSTFRLDTTVNGPVGTLPTALYVFGVNRGAETADFASLGLPGVVFDSVVLMTGAGELSGVDLAAGGTPFALPAGAATIDGNSFTFDVPLSVLPSLGLPPEQYGFNLWPRDFQGPPLSDPQIADFAPDDTVLAPGSVAPIPEPATWAQFALGLAGLAFAVRRSRRRLG